MATPQENAIKFTSAGFISLTVDGILDPASDSTIVTIKITDTGAGISKEKLATIFDKFNPADVSVARPRGAIGLGLAMSKALAEKMGGSIRVESALGVGTTFTVTVPLKNRKTEGPPAVISSTAAPILLSPTQIDVLLVEDYEPNVLVATLTLESLGYSYEVATNGLEALEKFRQGKYGVILMDIQMPEMDGLEATRGIRRMEAEKELLATPIIGLSAHIREQDKNRCIEAGMDDFVPKPFKLEELSRKIAYYIQPDRKAG